MRIIPCHRYSYSLNFLRRICCCRFINFFCFNNFTFDLIITKTCNSRCYIFRRIVINSCFQVCFRSAIIFFQSFHFLTGNLDRSTADQVFQRMLELARDKGTAFVLVTHDEELANRCDRQFRMTQGVLQPLHATDPSPPLPVA